MPTHRAGRARRTPATTTGAPPRLPSPMALGAAGLVAIESGHDARRHVVPEAHYAGELVALRAPRVHGLCGDLLLLGSLAVEPAPACARCAGAHEVTAAAEAHARRLREARPPRLLVRVARRIRTGRATDR